MFISVEVDTFVGAAFNVEKLVGIVLRDDTVDLYMEGENTPIYLHMVNKAAAKRAYQEICYALQDADMMISMIEVNSEDE